MIFGELHVKIFSEVIGRLLSMVTSLLDIDNTLGLLPFSAVTLTVLFFMYVFFAHARVFVGTPSSLSTYLVPYDPNISRPLRYEDAGDRSDQASDCCKDFSIQ